MNMSCFSLFSELNVRNALNVLHEAGFSNGDWYQLGQQLIEMAALRRITASDHKPSNCMIDTIAQWLQSDLKASWEKLAEAVTKVGGYGEATAKAVRQKAGIGKPNLMVKLSFQVKCDLLLYWFPVVEFSLTINDRSCCCSCTKFS